MTVPPAPPPTVPSSSRSSPSSSPCPSSSSTTLTVATFNVRNTTDRYEERKPLLLKTFHDLRADVVGLQECAFDPPAVHQGRFLAGGAEGGCCGGGGGDDDDDDDECEWRCLEARTRTLISVPGTDPNFRIDGNAIMVRGGVAGTGNNDGTPAAAAAARACCDGQVLHLNDVRVAQRVTVRLPGGARVRVVNTHLHHTLDEAGDATRLEQIEKILAWCDDGDDDDDDGMEGGTAPTSTHNTPRPPTKHVDHTILLGDFNCAPHSPTYDRIVKRGGYTSAHHELTGHEPPVTFHGGLVAPFMDGTPPRPTDYVFYRRGGGNGNGNGDNRGRLSAGRLVPRTVRLEGKDCHPTDGTLYASDHFALVVTFDLLLVERDGV